MAVLLDKEKRNYSAKTSNRCLSSHPDYQHLTGGHSVRSGDSWSCWIFGHRSATLNQDSPHLLPPFAGIFRDIGGGSEEKGRGWVVMLRIWVKAALSSIDDQHFKSQPALKWVGVRDQGHLHNSLKLTPELTSLKGRFAKPLGNANQFARGELGSAIFSLLETLK